MRATITSTLALSLSICAGTAFAQRPAGDPAAARNARPAPAQAPAAGKAAQPGAGVDPDRIVRNNRRMNELLLQWEEVSQKLKTLNVTMYRQDEAPDWGDRELYVGQALFKSPDLAWIDFKQVALDPKTGKERRDAKGNMITSDYERIICTGDEVWHYKVREKQIFIFPLEKNDRGRALDEGPLPFLFNMKADEARRRYQMSLIGENEKSAAIRVDPKLQLDKESFHHAIIRLDKQSFFPTDIQLVSPDQKSTKYFKVFGKPGMNVRIDDKNFKGVVMPKPWTVVRDNGDSKPAPRAAEARPRLGNLRRAPAQ